MLLKETVDDDVRIYCIFDSDYFTVTEVNERKEEVKKIGINIHIWERKELENYLIIPTAILRILKTESKRANNLVVADVESVIDQETKKMEDELINRLADAVQKRERKHSVSSARRIAKGRIDHLINRVCGKDLISALSKWSQSSYNVSLSPIKIAASLEISEIATEMKEIIKRIEKFQEF